MAATAKVIKNPKERDMKPDKREPVNIPNPITVLKIPRGSPCPFPGKSLKRRVEDVEYTMA